MRVINLLDDPTERAESRRDLEQTVAEAVFYLLTRGDPPAPTEIVANLGRAMTRYKNARGLLEREKKSR